ncbi:MAG: hypothetical protein IPM56_03270 [Ignavibacteriales bacterium]|nr:MAG: hypothetical protein IPM56_03270 [Ignavibacteriales bacterium]
MKKIISSIIDEEARRLTISTELFRKITDRGSAIAFNKNLETLVSEFDKDSVSTEFLRYIILTCAMGGSLDQSLKNED